MKSRLTCKLNKFHRPANFIWWRSLTWARWRLSGWSVKARHSMPQWWPTTPSSHFSSPEEGSPPQRMEVEWTASKWAGSAPFSEMSWIWQVTWYSFRPWYTHSPSLTADNWRGDHWGRRFSEWYHTIISPLASIESQCPSWAIPRV